MAGFTRLSSLSRYKHMYCNENKSEETYYSLLPELSGLEDPIISCNETYWAIPYQGGGGPVYISRHSDYGKVLPECGVLNGHKSQVLSTSFSSFHPGLLATASADCTVKLYVLIKGLIDIFVLFLLLYVNFQLI